MPDKISVFIKYALRLLSDLHSLQALLEQVRTNLIRSGEIPDQTESLERLNKRIAVQRNFLDLIRKQCPEPLTDDEGKIEKEIIDAHRAVSLLIVEIQPLLAQRRAELAELLSDPSRFRGHKKALRRNCDSPHVLDIKL